MAIFSCDIEANGLDPDTIWCIVAQDVDTKEIYRFVPTGLHLFKDLLTKGDTLVFHNGYGYDVPILEKLLNIDFTDINIEDTMILSQITEPRRDGGHSLASWGERLGFPKGDHSDWSQYSDEMLKYCIRDVEITTKLYKSLSLKGFSRDAIELEYETKRHCAQQEKNGWYFDEDKALRVLQDVSADITEVESTVREVFKPLPVFVPVNKAPKYTKKGELTARYKAQKEKGCFWTKDGEYGYNKYEPFNLGSRQQIGKYLINFGWKPTVLTETGQPKVSEEVLEGVDIPEAKLIARYLMLDKRRSMLQSWVNAFNPKTHAIHGRVHTIGTVTNRMSSSNPNMQQVVASNKEYGADMRSLFTVHPGKVLVGADLSGLELRCLAHYMNDEDYTNEILSGDIHAANGGSAGLIEPEWEVGSDIWKKGRNEAKRFIYAFLYGGGDDLIGKIVGGGKKQGKKIKEAFLDNTPALKKLRRLVEQASSRGYVKALDGRRIYVRSTHSALNFLLQSAGAIIAKRAWVIFHQNCTLPYKQVGVIHDELQIECAPEDADAIGKEIVKAMEATTDYYKLNCPITGEYSTGGSWNDTH